MPATFDNDGVRLCGSKKKLQSETHFVVKQGSKQIKNHTLTFVFVMPFFKSNSALVP